MKNISLETRNLYRALGELAYVIARADDRTTKMERIVFQEAVKEDLGKESWLAQDRFDWLDKQGDKVNVNEAYHRVMYTFRLNQTAITENLIEKFISVLDKVGGVFGITDQELDLIERFREDATKLYREK